MADSASQIVLDALRRAVADPGGMPLLESQNWQSAFLPGIFQGTYIDTRERDPERLAYSIGTLAKEADAQGFCPAIVGTAEKQAPATAQLPSTSVSYAWSNVRILAIPLAPGTQMVADLTYTQDGCTTEYEVWGMWPGDVDCANEAGEPDNGICANAGSINPDFSTVCDPTQLKCVPAKRPPSLR